MLPFSEMEYSDMKILEHIQQYSPSKNVEELEVPNPGGQSSVLKLEDDQLVMTLVGGDNLTAARMQGEQRIRGNSEKSADRFDGLLPIAEDRYTKVCLLEVRVDIPNPVSSPAYIRHVGPTSLHLQ